MKTFILSILLFSIVIADQNRSLAFGIQTKEQTKEQTKLQTYKQADGSSFEGISKGEGFFTYIELANGYIGVYNKESKSYEYALVKGEELLASGIPVNQTNVPKHITKISEQVLEKLQKSAFKKHL